MIAAKRLSIALGLLIAISQTLCARSVTLAWDLPTDGYTVSAMVTTRIYEVSGGTYTLVASADCSGGVCPTQVTFTTATGIHVWTARVADADGNESPNSNMVGGTPGSSNRRRLKHQ